MKAKEAGYVLSIDQASNCAGVSLWHNGDLIAFTELRSRSPDDPLPKRLQHQVPQLTAFLDKHVPSEFQIEKVLFESVRSKIVSLVIGAFLVCPRITAKISEYGNFIGSSSWKRWAKDRGAVDAIREVKGVKALRETGFPVDKLGITSDDIADSIMIYATWRDNR